MATGAGEAPAGTNGGGWYYSAGNQAYTAVGVASPGLHAVIVGATHASPGTPSRADATIRATHASPLHTFLARQRGQVP